MQSRQQLIPDLLTEAAYRISTTFKATSPNIITTSSYNAQKSNIYALLQQRIHADYPTDILCFPHQDIPINSKHLIWLISLHPCQHELPHQPDVYVLSIALARSRELYCSYIYDVSRKKLYRAIKGGGAFLNERRLRREEIMPLNEAVLRIKADYLHESNKKVPANKRVGVADQSTALEICRVAEGKTDLFMAMSERPHAFAAASLIAEEAGVRLMTVEGKPLRWYKESSFWVGVV
ncbi:inositol monophosphatase family protein [Shouchella clausii]|uniref:inositol monophosphatase family protein n=1 Tax=Shouchella clausii TaxID=79880 RepID=UPI00280C2F97|nr:inositol monophosphatase family protein [Shouchella clausii]WMM34141.1 inositol monophosphatase family protein [Shouchella clausii]